MALERVKWFSKSVKRMCEYGFVENTYFNPLKIEQVRLEGACEVKRELQDYQLTIEMANEISRRKQFVHIAKACREIG